MPAPSKSEAARARLVRVAPLAVILVATSIVASGARSPTRLDPELSWAAPSSAWPLGCGEAGVDLLALPLHAALTDASVTAFRLGMTIAAALAVLGGLAALAGIAPLSRRPARL